MKRTLALAVVASMALAGFARAEGPDVIAVRKAGQDLLAGTFDGIRGVVAAKGNITKLDEPAKAMARWIRVFPTLFPEGSDKGDTKALPAIWSDHAGFVKDADALAVAAMKLAADAKAGKRDVMLADFKAVGEACRSCHQKFKAK